MAERPTAHVSHDERGTAVDPGSALRAVSTAAKAFGMSGVGMHTLRHSFATHMLAAGVPLPTVSELLGHSFVAVTGDVHGHVSDQGARCAPVGSQQQWAGENVCRGYTNGYTAAERPPRILSETASDLLFSVGMTGFEPATPWPPVLGRMFAEVRQ